MKVLLKYYFIVEIGQLKSLQTLNLVNNKIAILPRELGQCMKLQTLQIDGNRIQFLIKELMRLPSLQEISASRNKLLYIPFGKFSIFLISFHFLEFATLVVPNL